MQQGMQVSQSIQDALFVKNDSIKGSPFPKTLNLAIIMAMYLIKIML